MTSLYRDSFVFPVAANGYMFVLNFKREGFPVDRKKAVHRTGVRMANRCELLSKGLLCDSRFAFLPVARAKFVGLQSIEYAQYF